MGLYDLKISAEFAKRLADRRDDDMVRVIVVFDTARKRSTGERRPLSQERSASIAVIRNAAEKALPAVDMILKKCGGRRLADQVNSLGTLPIETTRFGVNELVKAPFVRALLEDQPVTLLNERRSLPG